MTRSVQLFINRDYFFLNKQKQTFTITKKTGEALGGKIEVSNWNKPLALTNVVRPFTTAKSWSSPGPELKNLIPTRF